MILADDCSIRSSSLPGIGNRFRWGKRFKGGPPRSDALFGLAPRGVCTAVAVARNSVSSYLTFSPLPRSLWDRGGIFSVALSVAFRWRKPAIERPAVSRHAALWSSDVPLLRPRWFGGNSGCPTHSGCLNCQGAESVRLCGRKKRYSVATVGGATSSSSTTIRWQCWQVNSCSPRRISTNVCGGSARKHPLQAPLRTFTTASE